MYTIGKLSQNAVKNISQCFYFIFLQYFPLDDEKWHRCKEYAYFYFKYYNQTGRNLLHMILKKFKGHVKMSWWAFFEAVSFDRFNMINYVL